MAVFCAEYAWCSPREFGALTIEEYEQLREHLVNTGRLAPDAG